LSAIRVNHLENFRLKLQKTLPLVNYALLRKLKCYQLKISAQTWIILNEFRLTYLSKSRMNWVKNGLWWMKHVMKLLIQSIAFTLMKKKVLRNYPHLEANSIKIYFLIPLSWRMISKRKKKASLKIALNQALMIKKNKRLLLLKLLN
jgi:hypothetical protein